MLKYKNNVSDLMFRSDAVCAVSYTYNSVVVYTSAYILAKYRRGGMANNSI